MKGDQSIVYIGLIGLITIDILYSSQSRLKIFNVGPLTHADVSNLIFTW